MTNPGPLQPLLHKPVVGVKYHVLWGSSHGVVGVCVAVHEYTQEVILRSPKTKKLWQNPVKWSDLRLLRKHEQH